VEEVAAPHEPLGAVVHPREGLATEDEADVPDLARGGADLRRDVLRPAPTPLVRCPTEDRRPDAVDVETAPLDSAGLAWVVEVEELEIREPSIAAEFGAVVVIRMPGHLPWPGPSAMVAGDPRGGAPTRRRHDARVAAKAPVHRA